MFTNPFSPIFGGKPDVFFGRESLADYVKKEEKIPDTITVARQRRV